MSNSIESLLIQMSKYLEARNRTKFFEIGRQIQEKLTKMGLYPLDIDEIWRSKVGDGYSPPPSKGPSIDSSKENPYDE